MENVKVIVKPDLPNETILVSKDFLETFIENIEKGSFTSHFSYACKECMGWIKGNIFKEWHDPKTLVNKDVTYTDEQDFCFHFRIVAFKS